MQHLKETKCNIYMVVYILVHVGGVILPQGDKNWVLGGKTILVITVVFHQMEGHRIKTDIQYI